MGHGHDHGMTAGGRHRGRLLAVLLITGSVVAIQLVGALLSGSLALLADTGHMLTDVVGVAMALVATTVAQRPPTPRRTFGWQRVEVLAAAANALLLLGVAGYVLVEAVSRFRAPTPVDAPVMVVTATLGLAANAGSLALLARGQRESLNVRGAYLEVLGDLLGSVAVVAAGLVVWLTGFSRADAIASLLIAAFIVPRALALLRKTLHVLLQGAPEDVDLAEVRAHILAVPGVVDVHDLHAWTVTSGAPVLSAHVVIDSAVRDESGCGFGLLDRLCRCLAEDFDVAHSTFQLEPVAHRGHEEAVHD